MGIRMAAGVALVAAGLLATASPAWAGEAGALGACAELTDSGPGWAELRNDCGVAIEGSIALSTGERPACVPIAPRGTGTVTWEGEGVAEYAVDCI
ncbi:hypothetical protein [Amycolatopsis thermoflava]|uniref:Secreted protein n=1 Tax=Amycolatopsis thermoflava TaxID=84480 RepID=A0A3N2GUL6_9PSEU|nr:hypothetical protein [Amycolatopsis thermoflava]ROS40341.1 hypothetical protein EDD35_2673 [Amycolatopsis thermoflava]